MKEREDDDLNDDEAAISSQIEQARALRREDDLEESQAILLTLLNEYPEHPLILFEVGGSYDVMGEEEMAIPYYREAIEAGLQGDDLQECLVCLGSSLRLIGEHEEAVEVLERAVESFPTRKSSRVFLALAYYSDGQPHLAISKLMSTLLETTSDQDILAYADAFEYYIEELEEDQD